MKRTKASMGFVREIVPVGDAAVLALLGDAIDAFTLREVWSLFAALRAALGDAVLDVAPAYASVLVRFDPSRVGLATVMASVRGAVERVKPAPAEAARSLVIGVDFGSEHALDLLEVARETRLEPDEVVRMFCAATYRVAFLGFVAGFPYLTGLPQPLALPRLATPRPRVPEGSVAIAAGQCGIYPRPSPGGWRILGRTKADVFDPARDEAALFRPGDAVRFEAVGSLERALARFER